MKSTPWRLYFGFLFITGLLPGFTFSLGIYLAYKQLTLAVLGGVILGVMLVVVTAFWYRSAMRKRDPTFSFSDASTHQQTRIELNIAADEAYEMFLTAVQYIPGFLATRTSAQARRIEGTTGGGSAGYFSFASGGEMVRIVVGARGRFASYVRIESCPSDLFLVLDFGKNRQNVRMIATRLNEQIARRFDDQRIAKERAEMDRALTDAKLAKLQAQIEPHFLYNTLANAQLLTRSDPQRADVMLGNLIIYLRNTLPQSGETDAVPLSTLGREIERSRAYLEILKIRMGARLSFEIDVADSLANIPFAPMIVQTLVENAIKHGLEPKLGGGSILICASRAGSGVKLSVSDNGVGLKGGTSGTGLGLKNMRERLRLTYGDAASLSLSLNVPSGMVATITIPDAI
jgi:signal transduction histidine kinase